MTLRDGCGCWYGYVHAAALPVEHCGMQLNILTPRPPLQHACKSHYAAPWDLCSSRAECQRAVSDSAWWP